MKRIAVLLLSVILAAVTYGQNNDNQSREVCTYVMVVKSTDKTTAKIDLGDGTPLMVFPIIKEKRENLKRPLNQLTYSSKKGGEIDKFSSMFSGINLITHWGMMKKVNGESEVKECLTLIEE